MKPQRITQAHLPAVAELERAVFHAPWTEQSLALLTGESGVGFVVMQGERAAAYGGMLCVLDEGQITNIATHPDHRRLGLGRSVVQALIGYAKEHGLAEIFLEVRESNTAAILLYEQLGFVSVGRRPRFYTHPTEAALVMLLRVSDAELGD